MIIHLNSPDSCYHEIISVRSCRPGLYSMLSEPQDTHSLIDILFHKQQLEYMAFSSKISFREQV